MVRPSDGSRGGAGAARSGSSRRAAEPRSARGGDRRSGLPVNIGANFWHGRSFFIQIERCYGVQDKVCSVNLDEEKYVRCSTMLKEGIEKYFNGQILVETVDVPTLYAMEVRVMPDECHPQRGKRTVAQDAEAMGGKTMFSKIESKKWPKLDNVIEQLREFCRVSVRIELLGKELKAKVGLDGSAPQIVKESVNSGQQSLERDESLTALQRATFYCVHSCGESFELHTDGCGKADAVLYPGDFTLFCDDDSSYDRLTPDLVSVPASFLPVDITITASMKKQVTIAVVDHLDRPFPRFPLRLTPRNPGAGAQPVTIQTKANGRGKSRLGRGIYNLSYDGTVGDSLSSIMEDGQPQQNCPVAPLTQEVEVQDISVPQFFRICVRRLLFTVDIMLRTSYDEPVRNCRFTVKSTERGDKVVASGISTDIGVAMCDLAAGSYNLKIEPLEESPFIMAQLNLQVFDDGTFTPMEHTLETKHVDVQIYLVTPDGEAAPGCLFNLTPQFNEAASGTRAWEMSLRTDENGVATATMSLLEPYVFRVKATGKPSDYMPQQFTFQTDRRKITAVVARSIFGSIPEGKVAVIIDTSGSMGVYIKDIKAALNLTVVQQFHKSTKQFNVVTFTERVSEFRPELVECSTQNLEDAMYFCESMECGGCSGILEVIKRVFRFPDLEAMYIVTDGKCEVGEERNRMLNHVRALYFAHPTRPKINTIGINCVPKRMTYRGLEEMATLTQGTFRAVCLQQDAIDPIDARMAQGGGSIGHGLPGLDLATHQGVTTDEEMGISGDDCDAEAYGDDD